MEFLKNLSTVSCLALLCSTYAHAQGPAGALASTVSLKTLSVEELMNIEVTSVSKTGEQLSGAAAAVAVVSDQDIERSGATTVPQALRAVPGIFVARQAANTWAVSSRGFSSVNSEKLLVLSDTRSIYTPLYSGVFWDVQDYLMADIDRIEVIRGPGAALWGSNAVNGVINISTKNARDTQGAYVEALAGTEERAGIAARYGGQTERGTYYRVFGKYIDRDESFNSTPETQDNSQLAHGGFRADGDLSARDTFTVQGDMYRGVVERLQPSVNVIGRQGPQGRLRVGVSGGNVLARWRRTLNSNSDMQLRVYYDRTHRNDPSYLDDLDTVDLDFQHRFAPTPQQEVVWGVNERYTSNRNRGKIIFAVEPATSKDNLLSGFVQDQITLLDILHLTAGVKLEHNNFSGFETQPSVRATLDFSPTQTFWAAVSRAVRVPTRLERDIAVDASNPAGNPVFRLLGNRDFESEKLLAYELGYRWQALNKLSLDVAVFRNQYQGLAALELGTPFVDPRDGRTIIPVVNKNFTDGRTQGFETALIFSPVSAWRLSGSYSYLDMQLDPRGLDLNRGRFIAGATPRHQVGLHSSVDIVPRLQVDAQYRYVSAIRSLPEILDGTGLSGYAELDVRVAWQSSDQMTLALVGQDLLHDHHAEFGAPGARGEIQRSVHAKATWDF